MCRDKATAHHRRQSYALTNILSLMGEIQLSVLLSFHKNITITGRRFPVLHCVCRLINISHGPRYATFVTLEEVAASLVQMTGKAMITLYMHFITCVVSRQAVCA